MATKNFAHLVVAEAEGLLSRLISDQDPELFERYDYEILELLVDKGATLNSIEIRDLDCIGEVSYTIDLARHHSDDLALSKKEMAINDAFFSACTSKATGEISTEKISASIADPVAKWFAANQKERDIGAVFHCCQRLMDQSRHGRNPLVILRVAYQRYFFTCFPPIARDEARAEFAKMGAESLHGKPGGSRDKRRQIREIWATGKYSNRDLCAEQECAALEMSFSSARKALRGTAEPT